MFTFTTVAISMSAILATALAAPTAAIEQRSSSCQVIGSTGSATHPVWGTGSTSQTAVGQGLRVVCDGKTVFNAEGAPDSTTIKAADSGLPVDIAWTVDLAVAGFTACSATPAGASLVTGLVDAHVNPFASYFSCTVDLTI